MSITDLPMSYSKAELLEALEALRPAAVETDRVNLAEHRKAEKEHLAEFKRACREAAKWDYETAKKHHFNPEMYPEKDGYRKHSGPTCPRSEVSYLDSLLDMVGRLNQDRFTLANGGKWHTIYRALTAEVPSIKGLC